MKNAGRTGTELVLRGTRGCAETDPPVPQRQQRRRTGIPVLLHTRATATRAGGRSVDLGPGSAKEMPGGLGAKGRPAPVGTLTSVHGLGRRKVHKTAQKQSGHNVPKLANY